MISILIYSIVTRNQVDTTNIIPSGDTVARKASGDNEEIDGYSSDEDCENSKPTKKYKTDSNYNFLVMEDNNETHPNKEEQEIVNNESIFEPIKSDNGIPSSVNKDYEELIMLRKQLIDAKNLLKEKDKSNEELKQLIKHNNDATNKEKLQLSTASELKRIRFKRKIML